MEQKAHSSTHKIKCHFKRAHLFSFNQKKSHQNQTKMSAERLELLPTAHLWTHSLAVNTDKYFMCFRVLPVG